MVGENSSGEVEFVLVRSEDDLWIGVGSDHTDRTVETYNVTVSKQMCDKPIAPELWCFEDVRDHWELHCAPLVDRRRRQIAPLSRRVGREHPFAGPNHREHHDDRSARPKGRLVLRNVASQGRHPSLQAILLRTVRSGAQRANFSHLHCGHFRSRAEETNHETHGCGQFSGATAPNGRRPWPAKSLLDRAYNEIKYRIITCHYRPGGSAQRSGHFGCNWGSVARRFTKRSIAS